MDLPMDGDSRRKAIDMARQNVLDRTMLNFLPCAQTHFVDDYANLPGDKGMAMRDRVKLIRDDYRRKFLRRVEIVVQHCRQALFDEVSEFNWEADAWRDVFGRLRDDERLRMDKREYNFKATLLPRVMAGSKAYMGKRIPDMTFGLSSYVSGDPLDEGIDERERRIRRSLHVKCLKHYVCDRFGLMVDGKWGKTTVLFPFAVYEAKKNDKSELAVKIQLKLALNAYLKMLDDLLIQPDNPKTKEERQLPQNTVNPLFGFTSSGSIWKLYVGYLPAGMKAGNSIEADDPLCDTNSHMKLIWWGDLIWREHAGELLDIVDQIHEYAVTIHRPLVASHLEKLVAKLRFHRDIYGVMKLDQDDSLTPVQDWFQTKYLSADVRKVVGKKRKRDKILTDDDEYRAALDARLKKWDRETCFEMEGFTAEQDLSI
ncbi:hypothetical protein AbraIFM66951_002083 [Aspergillus brasiliensis]|uniref:Uncharacterized protein n=1 Tax=Aspergillus brasiliensis TaxID=319629 RepID=A0A9W6DSL6_9EURO|nr:hypothetical protein AbraCBS73388_001785 [Aspergillus brasiliensis]GKZ49514.1 hypothetical protein AbraIFM66951_002083 [Aspergillus brasiliensis]